MFSWLFGKKEPRVQAHVHPPQPSAPPPVVTATVVEPPTDKQLRYARSLGIKVPAGIGKWELSRLIDAAKPKPAEPVVEEEDYPPELIEAQEKWQKLIDQRKWMLAIWQKGKTRHAEIVTLDGVDIDAKDRLVITCSVTKLKREAHIGLCINDEGRQFEIKTDCLLWCAIIDEIHFSEPEQWEGLRKQLDAKLSSLPS